MSRRPLRYRIAAAVLAPLVFLGLVEAVLRIAGYRYDPTEDLAGSERRVELTRPEIYRPHPRYLWTVRPRARIDEPDVGFFSAHTNSLGFRGPEFPDERRPDEFLVLCLGDSVLFGIGLRDDETVPVHLEEALRARAPEGRKVRVLNGAIPGWSSVSGMRLFEDLHGLEPDVVVFWFGMNDAKDNLGVPDRILRGAGRHSASGILERSRTFQLLRSISVSARRGIGEETRVSAGDFREAVERLEATVPETVFVRYPERTGQTIRELSRILARAEELRVRWIMGPGITLTPLAPAPKGFDLWGARVETDGGPTLRLSGPGPIDRMTPDVLARDLGRLEQLYANFEKLMELLPANSPGSEDLFGGADGDDVFTDNCHLTPRGARLAAEALATRLEPLLTSATDR
jgi:lysophospholipase L1-like esterase